MTNSTSMHQTLVSLAQDHGRRAWATAYALCGDAAQAEDIVQQAFLVALERKEEIGSHIEWPWLARVVINLHRNEWRKAKRRGEVVDDRKLEGAPDKRSKDPAIDAEIADVSRRLHVQLDQLPDSEREAIVLTYVSGLTQVAAANLLGISRDTLATHVRRGIQRLRERMAKDDREVVALLSSAAVLPPTGGYEQAFARWCATGKRPFWQGLATKPKVLLTSVAALVIAVIASTTVVWLIRDTPPQAIVASDNLGSDPVADSQPPADGTTRKESGPSIPPPIGDGPTSEEIRRFLEVRPRKITELRPRYTGDQASNRNAELERALREEVQRKRELHLHAGPWKYDFRLAAEVPGNVLGLNAMQNRRGWLNPNGTAGGTPSGEASDAAEIDPLSDSILVTAMAMLAWTRAGYHHKAEWIDLDGTAHDGRRANVRAALLWARRVQDASGNFAHSVARDPILHHAAATLAMCELYRATGDQVILPIARRALVKLYELRAFDGGWSCAPNDESDVLATGFALLAFASVSIQDEWSELFTKEEDGFEVHEVLDTVAYWAWSLRDTDSTWWSASLEVAPNALPSRLLADAVFVLAMHWGSFWTLGDLSVERALLRLRNQPKTWSEVDPMTRFFGSIALWTVDPDRSVDWSLDTLAAIDSGATKPRAHEGENPGEGTLSDASVFWQSADRYSARFGMAFCTAATVFSLYQCRSYLPSIQVSDESGTLLAEHVGVRDAMGNPKGRVIQLSAEAGRATVLVCDLPEGSMHLAVNMDGEEVLSTVVETRINVDLAISVER